MCRTHKPISIGQAVYKDVSAGRHAQFASVFPVSRVGIRNVQRTMKLALGISAVDYVNAFGCTVIALSCFRPDGFAAERDLVRS